LVEGQTKNNKKGEKKNPRSTLGLVTRPAVWVPCSNKKKVQGSEVNLKGGVNHVLLDWARKETGGAKGKTLSRESRKRGGKGGGGSPRGRGESSGGGGVYFQKRLAGKVHLMKKNSPPGKEGTPRPKPLSRGTQGKRKIVPPKEEKQQEGDRGILCGGRALSRSCALR